MVFAYWNIRGLNNPAKKRVLQGLLNRHRIRFCCLAEAKIKGKKVEDCLYGLRRSWKCLKSNEDMENTRIIVWWDPEIYKVEQLVTDLQIIHCKITVTSSNKTFLLSAIHGANDPIMRTRLWDALQNIAGNTTLPWLVMGDFNVVRSPDEKMGGNCINMQHSLAFNDCLFECSLFDLKWSGQKFTWSNNQVGDNKISCKLDRALVNAAWTDIFQNGEAIFLDYSTSDHSPILVKSGKWYDFGPKPFKFFNVWMEKEGFMAIVEEAWNMPISSNLTPLSGIAARLKNVKKSLSLWNKSQVGDISALARREEEKLAHIQQLLALDPSNESLAISEKEGRRTLQQSLMMEESLLKPKSRIKWLNLGDKNNKFFHLSLKSHQHKNSFGCIHNADGNVIEDPTTIKAEAQNYFSQLFKRNEISTPQHEDSGNFLINKTLSPDQQEMLSSPILEEEIKRTVFALDGAKAPGPDGFNAHFFKSCWTIIGKEVTEAICWFFNNPYMPRDVNSTFLCLIPKVDIPHSFADFRPIALCNVLYKIIAKILANRLQRCVSSLVAGNQSAFIKGRNITDNILICHDIVKGIDRSSSPPIAVMKVDIHKAYDSVDRQYLM